jgi:prepilin-type N-terminal cleavage/methylation domain-containing protein
MSNRGFSLFELLTAMVILAILAAISLKVVNARNQAYLAVMQSDLRNLASMQEAYYIQDALKPNGPRYAPNAKTLGLTPSADVQLTMVGMREGWTGRAQHMRRTDFRCALYMGDIKAIIQPYEPAIEEGVMECEPKSQKGGKGKGN